MDGRPTPDDIVTSERPSLEKTGCIRTMYLGMVLLTLSMGVGCSGHEKRSSEESSGILPEHVVCIPTKWFVEKWKTPVDETRYQETVTDATEFILSKEGITLGSDAAIKECTRQLFDGPPSDYEDPVGILEDPNDTRVQRLPKPDFEKGLVPVPDTITYVLREQPPD